MLASGSSVADMVASASSPRNTQPVRGPRTRLSRGRPLSHAFYARLEKRLLAPPWRERGRERIQIGRTDEDFSRLGSFGGTDNAKFFEDLHEAYGARMADLVVRPAPRPRRP